MRIKRFLNFLLVLSILVISCNDQEESESLSGSINIALTDAPFPTDLVSEANVSINKIEIRQKGDEQQENYIVLTDEEQSFNLLDLRNGVTATLVNLDIEAGEYDQLRLYVSEASVVLKDSTTYDLTIPSGSQSGIKVFINPSIEVVGNLSTELLLDFDVNQSFVVQGNPNTPAGINGFLFKPTIKASNLTTAGSLVGMVTDSTNTGLSGATVSVFAADTLNTSALTNESGDYTVLGLQSGQYKVVFEYDSLNSITRENIDIIAGNATVLDAQFEE